MRIKQIVLTKSGSLNFAWKSGWNWYIEKRKKMLVFGERKRDITISMMWNTLYPVAIFTFVIRLDAS